MALKITSNFAVLDVKTGRKTLAKRFNKYPFQSAAPLDERIPVTIKGFIYARHSDDDGVSIEFAVDVASAEVELPDV